MDVDFDFDFDLDFDFTRSEKILLTPRLKQAVEILKMSSQELFEYVEEQIEENPVLTYTGDEVEIQESEFVDPDIAMVSEEDDNSLVDDSMMNNSAINDSVMNDSVINDSMMNDSSVNDPAKNDFRVDEPVEALSLKDHLLYQLRASGLDKQQEDIAEYIIDNIDENGYLTAGLPEVSKYFNIPAIKVQKVLKIVQSLDPPGICARNLKECLIIQMDQMENIDRDAVEIVNKYLDGLAANNISGVAENMGLSVEKVEEIFNFIRTLEPKPGREFYTVENTECIVPDVYAKKTENKFEVSVNQDSIPQLGISKYYLRILEDELNKESEKFIQNKINTANWLIKCIDMRQTITKKAAEYIVRNQLEFLEKGKKYIKQLSLRSAAEECSLHEHILKQILEDKYLQCSWGNFEMKFFFN